MQRLNLKAERGFTRSVENGLVHGTSRTSGTRPFFTAGFTRSLKVRIAQSALWWRRRPPLVQSHDSGVSSVATTTMRTSSAGFTLIETLVAISILLTAIAGPMTIASKGLSSAVFARDQITAFYLAQEAVEHIRNVRDENVFKGNGWLDTLGPCMNGTPCTVDAPNASVQNCSGGTCDALLFAENTGFFNHQSGDETKFIREVEVELINAIETSISVTVSWRTGLLDRTFKIRENVLNWQ